MSLILSHHGMLAEVNKVVGALYVYEYNHQQNKPFYVLWKMNNCAYINKNRCKIINVYELYFKQPLLKDAISSNKVVQGDYRKLQTSYSKRKEITYIIDKYIKPIDNIQSQIKHFMCSHENEIKIGCHIRGRRFSEFDFTNEKIYNKCTCEKDYFKTYMSLYILRINNIIKTLNNKKYQIFIFTDNEPALNYLKQHIKENIKYYDSIRSNRFFKAEIHTNRNINREKCGEDIVKEIFTMLKMNYFISAKYGNIPLFVVNGNDQIKHVTVD